MNMGKIKGWKRTKNTNTEILYEANFNSNGTGEYVRIRKNNNRWHLFIYGGNIIGFPHSGGVHVSEVYQTKQQALKHAMKYMRANPNG